VTVRHPQRIGQLRFPQGRRPGFVPTLS
jgi:hypothetical protein